MHSFDVFIIFIEVRGKTWNVNIFEGFYSYLRTMGFKVKFYGLNQDGLQWLFEI